MNAIKKIKTVEQLITKLTRKYFPKSYFDLHTSQREEACLMVCTMAYIAAAVEGTWTHRSEKWKKEAEDIRLAMKYIAAGNLHSLYASKEKMDCMAAFLVVIPSECIFAVNIGNLLFKPVLSSALPPDIWKMVATNIRMNFFEFQDIDFLNQFKTHLIAYDFDFDDLEFKR